MGEQKPLCPACGSPLLPGQGQCPGCGRDVTDVTEALPEPLASEATSTSGSPSFSDFEITREIGRGGMGTVYEAHQRSMQRDVALKVLDTSAVLSRKSETRFEREAWIGGRLNHPNIVRVYAQGKEGRSHYIAMELARGDSLGDEIKRARTLRPMAASDSAWRTEHVRRVVSLFVGVADALAYVHSRGIVHRDIKPSNLLFSEEGSRLMLSDFGLARDEEAASLTQRGDFLGTIRYMSPEQLLAQRAAVDHRSDIWSLGVTLYEAVTLQLPYSGDSEEAYISAVSTKDPAPARTVDRSIPRDLETVLMKCLERDPDRRYASAEELKADLLRFLRDQPVLATRPGPVIKSIKFARRRRAVVGVAATAAVVVAAIAIHSARQKQLRERHTATLERLEDGGRISEYEARLAIGRELEPDELELRNAFLSGRLPSDLGLRFARYLLQPDMLVNPYVDRTEYQTWRDYLQANVTQWHWDWGLVAVVQATMHVDGNVVERPAYAPWGALILLEGTEVGSLSVGQHTLGLELNAWFFDVDDIVSPDDEMPGASDPTTWVWTPGAFDGAAAGTTFVYGPHEKPWQEFWPGFRDSVQHVEVGPIRYPAIDFTIVEGPLAESPVRISSPGIDQEMQAAVELTCCNLVLWEDPAGYSLEIGVRATKPLPAPLVSVIEVETPWGPGYSGRMWDDEDDDDERGRRKPGASVFIDKGEMDFQQPRVPLVWTSLRRNPQSPPLPRTREALEDIDRVPVRVTLRPPTSDEAPGIDSCWNGILAFDTVADFIMWNE